MCISKNCNYLIVSRQENDNLKKNKPSRDKTVIYLWHCAIELLGRARKKSRFDIPRIGRFDKKKNKKTINKVNERHSSRI